MNQAHHSRPVKFICSLPAEAARNISQIGAAHEGRSVPTSQAVGPACARRALLPPPPGAHARGPPKQSIDPVFGQIKGMRGALGSAAPEDEPGAHSHLAADVPRMSVTWFGRSTSPARHDPSRGRRF
jgi:hypothetical protein